ncbi:hypothetical protein Gogos_003462, partial [Gossypium gossypioides]|nr:hypothetical protein [Gossypium gossypioides]
GRDLPPRGRTRIVNGKEFNGCSEWEFDVIKFEIQVAGKNLFLISFDSEEDLEMTLEGRPGLFRRKLIIFDRLYTEGAPVKDDVVGRDDAGNPVEKSPTLDQQGVECMDLEGGASDLVALDNVNTQFEPISPIEENSKRPKKASWKQIAKGDQRLLEGKSAGNNENIMLEYSWIGESTGSKEASACAEGVYSLD